MAVMWTSRLDRMLHFITACNRGLHQIVGEPEQCIGPILKSLDDHVDDA